MIMIVDNILVYFVTFKEKGIYLGLINVLNISDLVCHSS